MLDLQTLTFASVIATTISTLFFTVIWRLNKHIAGMNTWLFAVYSQTLGWLMLSLRGQVSDFLSIVLGNYLILQSLLLFYLGIRQLLEKDRLLLPSLTSLILFFIPIQFYFTYIEPNVIPRIYLVYGVSIMTMCLIIHLLKKLPKINQTTGVVMYTWVALIIIIMSVARVISVTPSLTGLYDSAITNYISALVGFFLPQGMTLGVFILAYEKREQSIDLLRKQAKQDAELKNRYLATLSHELRTPLNGIVGIAQVMMEQLAEKTTKRQRQQQLETIILSGQHLAELANNVLEYAAMEESQDKQLKLSPQSLRFVLNNIAEIVTPLAAQKSLEFNLTLADDLPSHVNIDVAKIRSILINLVSNSIKYTEVGTVELTVNLLSDKNTIVFSVSDTGRGLSKSDFQRMLMPFTRGKLDIHKQSGVGLGLAIVQYLLNAMKSELCWQEKKSQGTTLSFELAVDIPEPSVLNDTAQIDSQYTVDHSNSAPIPKLNILLVEDIELNIDILSQLLNKQHTLTVAKTGKQAIKQLTFTAFDVVLLDMQLPDISGIEVFNNQQDLELNKSTPVIALTASVSSQDINHYQSLKFLDLVEKPIIKSKLLSALAKVSSQNNTPLEKSNSSQIDHGFDPEPFNFLIENLPLNQVFAAVNNIPNELAQETSTLIMLLEQNKETEFLQLAHTMSSRYGQFGLINLNQELKLMSRSMPSSPRQLTKLKHLMQDALPILQAYLKKHHEK